MRRSVTKRRITAMCLILMVPVITFAQPSEVTYDLRQFRLPYLKRQTLEFNLDLSGYQNKQALESAVNGGYESKTRQGSFVFNPDYTFYLNSPNIIFSQSAGGQLPQWQLSSGTTNTWETENRNTNLNIYYNGSIHEYLSKKFYLSQRAGINLSGSQREEENSYLNESDIVTSKHSNYYDYRSSNGELTILVGWGRIEHTEDARLAVYILNDLQKAGILSREVQPEDIEQLAIRISEVMNERFFDSREKKIWELEQIDTLLHELDLLKSDDITYFTLLNDNWDFATGPVRRAGINIDGGLITQLEYDNYHNEIKDEYPLSDSLIRSENRDSYRTLGIGATAGVAWHYPLNLFYQLDFSLSATVLQNQIKNVYDAETDDSREDSYKTPWVGNEFTVNFSYYPNTRTALSFYNSQSYYRSSRKDDVLEDLDYSSFRNSTGIDLNYYISPQLRLNADASFQYSLDKTSGRTESTNNYHYLNYSLGFVYKII